jgi:preprotein translocase subunit SecG
MKTEKVYFPRWMAWFFILIFIPLFIAMEYEATYGNKPYPIMGALFGFIFILIIVMMFLVSYRKIPYMIIERQTKTKKEEK